MMFQRINELFPEKFYFSTKPKKMSEVFRLLVAKCASGVILVSHFD